MDTKEVQLKAFQSLSRGLVSENDEVAVESKHQKPVIIVESWLERLKNDLKRAKGTSKELKRTSTNSNWKWTRLYLKRRRRATSTGSKGEL